MACHDRIILMISHEARHQRKWGQYPNLAEILGDKPSGDLDGRLSTDRSFVEHLANATGVLNLLEKHLDEVVVAARSDKRREIRSEVEDLADEIHALANRLQDESRRARNVLQSLD